MHRIRRSALRIVALTLLSVSGCVPGQVADMVKQATRTHPPEEALPAIGEPLSAAYRMRSLRTSGRSYALDELRDTVTVLALWGMSADSQAVAMRDLDSLYARFGRDVRFIVLVNDGSPGGLDSTFKAARWAHDVDDIVAAHDYLRPIFDRSGGALSPADGPVWWQLPAFLAVGPDTKVAARSVRHPLELIPALDSTVAILRHRVADSTRKEP